MTEPDTAHVVPYVDQQAAYLIAWPAPFRLTPKAEAEAEPEAGL